MVPHGEGEDNYRPSDLDDFYVQRALRTWAAFIERQLIWDFTMVEINHKDIVLSSQEVNEKLGPVIVWRDTTRHLVRHLIARLVTNGVYEWIEVTQLSIRDARKPVNVQLFPFYIASDFGRIRFAIGAGSARRLTEICSVFAEQQIQFFQRGVDLGIQHIQEHFEGYEGDSRTLRYDIAKIIRFHKDNLDRTIDDLQQIQKREREKLENNVRGLEQQKQILEDDRSRQEDLENRSAETQRQLDECQRAANNAEQEFHRKEKEANHWIMMAALIGGAIMFLMIGIFMFMLCRKTGREIIEKSQEMNHPLPNRQPGLAAINIAEIDPRFRCYRDPHVAALNHSILADENGQFGINQIEKVTEREGIDVSAVTRKSTIRNAEGEFIAIQELQGGVKGAVEKNQRRQMHIEPFKEIVQNAVVVQEEVMDQIVEVMETDKAPECQTVVNQ